MSANCRLTRPYRRSSDDSDYQVCWLSLSTVWCCATRSSAQKVPGEVCKRRAWLADIPESDRLALQYWEQPRSAPLPDVMLSTKRGKMPESKFGTLHNQTWPVKVPECIIVMVRKVSCDGASQEEIMMIRQDRNCQGATKNHGESFLGVAFWRQRPGRTPNLRNRHLLTNLVCDRAPAS